MGILPVFLFGTVFILGVLAVLEVYSPRTVLEGFASGPGQGQRPRNSFWGRFTAPRSDIDSAKEDLSLIRDPRYFADYADVTRLGVKYDFCRMVATKAEPENFFFACALNGTDKLDTTKFRTKGTADGFRISQDDYMRDINGDGRDDYCRIIKWKDGTYQPVCVRANDIGFETKEVIDPSPPEDISLLLRMYIDCVIWLRLFGDMKDVVENVKVQVAGALAIDETPKKEKTEGLELLGGNQFLRLSDSTDLSLGTIVPLRSIRCWMVWVYFEEFTNNAKIFDFGNGAGRDNVFLGIYGKGDESAQEEDLRPALCNGSEFDTVPTCASGAQPVSELDPKDLMRTSDANVDEYTCVGFETMPRKLGPSFATRPAKTRKTGKATLLFEVWDQQNRKMRLKLSNSIPRQKWVHICITATNNDGFRPNIALYLNGEKKLEKENGWLPSTSSMTNCYIGKSNWSNSVSKFENKDELFRGKLFDFRAYRASLSEGQIQESYDWGKEKLKLN
jgi:hypothetical protein